MKKTIDDFIIEINKIKHTIEYNQLTKLINGKPTPTSYKWVGNHLKELFLAFKSNGWLEAVNPQFTKKHQRTIITKQIHYNKIIVFISLVDYENPTTYVDIVEPNK